MVSEISHYIPSGYDSYKGAGVVDDGNEVLDGHGIQQILNIRVSLDSAVISAPCDRLEGPGACLCQSLGRIVVQFPQNIIVRESAFIPARDFVDQ